MRQRNKDTWWKYVAACQNCDWTADGKNGLGIAAQHHDRTGHTVHVAIDGLVKYLSDKDDVKIKEARGYLLL